MATKLLKQGKGFVLYVPLAMARSIPRTAQFQAEWTDDGILFRFVPPGTQPPQPNLPAWLKNGK